MSIIIHNVGEWHEEWKPLLSSSCPEDVPKHHLHLSAPLAFRIFYALPDLCCCLMVGVWWCSTASHHEQVGETGNDDLCFLWGNSRLLLGSLLFPLHICFLSATVLTKLSHCPQKAPAVSVKGLAAYEPHAQVSALWTMGFERHRDGHDSSNNSINMSEGAFKTEPLECGEAGMLCNPRLLFTRDVPRACLHKATTLKDCFLETSITQAWKVGAAGDALPAAAEEIRNTAKTRSFAHIKRFTNQLRSCSVYMDSLSLT